MKKILLFIFTISIAFTSYSQLSEDFESGTFPPVGWTTFIGANGLGIVENWVEAGTTNKYARVIWEDVTDGSEAEDWLVTPQFTVDASTPLLTFDQVVFNLTNYGSTFTVRVSTLTQTTHADFTIVDTQSEDDIRQGAANSIFDTHAIDLSAYAGQAIYVAFVWSQDDGDGIGLDNMEMIANATAPNIVTTPTPTDGAVNVFVDPSDSDLDGNPDMFVIFDWDPATAGDPATSYDIYLGDSAATLNLLGATSNDNVNITGMQYDTLYFWKIVAKNVGGEAVGSSTWSFTTQADPTASIEDDKLASSVKMYPTATSESFTINNQSNITLTSVSLYDVNGRVVLTNSLDNLIGKKSINVANLSSGLYFVEINSADAKLVKKLIIK